LDVDKALNLGNAIENFHEGHAVIGQCAGARLPVPIYETALALARKLEERGDSERAKITVISPQTISAEVGSETGTALERALESRRIEVLPEFAVKTVQKDAVITSDGRSLNFDLLMLLPPFKGSPAAAYLRITNDEGYINVETTLRVTGHHRIYAVGDCVNFAGPKMGHMAVRQAEIAAANLAAEINGQEPVEHYLHEVKMVIDDGEGKGKYESQKFSDLSHSNLLVQHGVLNYCARAE
jgi:sulfide:quinone oxidoreductase